MRTQVVACVGRPHQQHRRRAGGQDAAIHPGKKTLVELGIYFSGEKREYVYAVRLVESCSAEHTSAITLHER